MSQESLALYPFNCLDVENYFAEAPDGQSMFENLDIHDFLPFTTEDPFETECDGGRRFEVVDEWTSPDLHFDDDLDVAEILQSALGSDGLNLSLVFDDCDLNVLNYVVGEEFDDDEDDDDDGRFGVDGVGGSDGFGLLAELEREMSIKTSPQKSGLEVGKRKTFTTEDLGLNAPEKTVKTDQSKFNIANEKQNLATKESNNLPNFMDSLPKPKTNRHKAKIRPAPKPPKRGKVLGKRLPSSSRTAAVSAETPNSCKIVLAEHDYVLKEHKSPLKHEVRTAKSSQTECPPSGNERQIVLHSPPKNVGAKQKSTTSPRKMASILDKTKLRPEGQRMGQNQENADRSTAKSPVIRCEKKSSDIENVKETPSLPSTCNPSSPRVEVGNSSPVETAGSDCSTDNNKNKKKLSILDYKKLKEEKVKRREDSRAASRGKETWDGDHNYCISPEKPAVASDAVRRNNSNKERESNEFKNDTNTKRMQLIASNKQKQCDPAVATKRKLIRREDEAVAKWPRKETPSQHFPSGGVLTAFELPRSRSDKFSNSTGFPSDASSLTSSTRRSRSRSSSASSSLSSMSSASSSSSRERSSRRRSRSRSRSSRAPSRAREPWHDTQNYDHQTAIEERRIVYVGRLPAGFNKYDLERKMQKFGVVLDTSIHKRHRNENYGFVTFATSTQASRAKEDGRQVPGCENFDFSYGGRREFCGMRYADFDREMAFNSNAKRNSASSDFQDLLKQTMSMVQKSKTKS